MSLDHRLRRPVGAYLAFAVAIAVLAASPTFAQTFTTLFNFGSSTSSVVPYGSSPQSTLVEVKPGIFYGTSYLGGTNGCGTLFSITRAGLFTKLHDFAESEGCGPSGQLIVSADGMLYGVTLGQLGSRNLDPTLFRSDLKGNVTRIEYFHSDNYIIYAGPPTAGAEGSIYIPVTLVPAPDSANANPNTLRDAVYKYELNGSFSIVGSSVAAAVGMTPLVLASDGNLYGGDGYYDGNVLTNRILRVAAAGITVIHEITQYQNLVALGEGYDGKLYVLGASTLPACSSIASLNLDGSDYTILRTFCLNCLLPETGFTLASDGALYAGAFGPRGIFKIASSGEFSDVYKIAEPISYLESLSGLAAEGSDGLLYGELIGSGSTSPAYLGSIYSLDVGLRKPPPRIFAFVPASGSPGTKVIISGEHLLETNGVAFNGIPASFTVNSAGFVTAIVPEGSTGGLLTISTPNGSQSSTATFVLKE